MPSAALALWSVLLFSACGGDDVSETSPSPTPSPSPAPTPTATPLPTPTPTPTPIPDADADTFPADEDCDDNDPNAYPGADEVCDDADNDCNGEIDDGLFSTYYPDEDGDGFGIGAQAFEGDACAIPEAAALDPGDCDDGDAAIHPGAADVCDGIDNDCDGIGDPEADCIQDVAESGDAFGTALAAADFDQDGYEDLAIGVPDEDLSVSDAGLVHVLYGGPDGPDPARQDLIALEGLVEGIAPQAGDRFGAALSTGDVNGDLYPDLIIGVPQDGPDASTGAGFVLVIHAGAEGLDTSALQYWDQDLILPDGEVIAVNEPGDRFGASLACADFDADGAWDLIVGAPGEGIDGTDTEDAGEITILFGSDAGLDDERSRTYKQDNNSVPGASESGDLFGTALATGDFNGDGFFDLAVGVPGEGIYTSDKAHAGSVNVLFGSDDRLKAQGSQDFYQDLDNVKGSSSKDENFGAALAAGDLNGDGFDDLVVGVPGEKINSAAEGGTVHVFYGAPDGLDTSDDPGAEEQAWYLERSDVPGGAEAGDRLGSAVATGDLDGDGVDDLIIGIPYKAVDGTAEAGHVLSLFGSAEGVSSEGAVLWNQSIDGFEGDPEEAAHMGAALLGADVNGDGFDDVAIGLPGASLVVAPGCGAVNTLFGGTEGISAEGDRQWNQGILE